MKNKVNDPFFWNSLYKENLDGWDLKSSSPGFADLLNNGFFNLQSSLLVVGCGKGYDAITASEAGLNVSAIDFSSEAIAIAKENSITKNLNINFIREDIFHFAQKTEYRFDYIYDYVTYCAIDPGRREEYAEAIFSLLKDGGKFVIILFPVELREGGPPYGIDEDETKKIFSELFTLELIDHNINSIKPRQGREILHIYGKEIK